MRTSGCAVRAARLRAARFSLALVAGALVAGCGGGGGGTGGPPVVGGPTPTPTTAPTPTPAPSATPTPFPQTFARSDAQGVLAMWKVLGTGGYYPGGFPVGVSSARRRPAAARTPSSSTSPCQSGGASGVGSVQVYTADPFTLNGVPYQLQTYVDYYDTQCQQHERNATVETPVSNTASSGTAVGYTTEFGKTGSTLGIGSYSLSYTPTSITVLADEQPQGNGGAQMLHWGTTCTLPSQGANSLTCGMASADTIYNSGFLTTGLVETVVETFDTSGNVSATISGTTYSGSGLALASPAPGNTAWGVTGGTQVDALSGSANVVYNGSIATSGSLTLTGSGSGTKATGTLAATVLHATVVQGSVTLATIDADADGNGTVLYGNGSTNVVAGFTITQ
ncbi:MAG: hypothetical protein JWN27_1321 [Candidatus Eremiobacteraeota bacterium]|nr:hypothetical protein [Candidatus Eremiobacteraeota bacterium]